jgi:hypothetical protein
VDELPAGGAEAAGAASPGTNPPVAGHPVPGDNDPPELLDVDVDQLPGTLSLVAVGRLRWCQAASLAEADLPQPSRDGRERQAEDLGDLGRGHPQPPQRLDRPDAVGGKLGRAAPGGGAAVAQAGFAFGSPAGQPLGGAALADAGGLGRRHQPSSSIRLTKSLRLFGQVRALAWSFIRCPP